MIEDIIFANLIHNEQYARKTVPFLKNEYFQIRTNKILFELISEYINKYNSLPTRKVLSINISERTDLSDDEEKTLLNQVSLFEIDANNNEQWLLDQTEQFCQDKAVYNAIMKSIQIFDGKAGMDKGAIPSMLSDALAVSFDTNIGHDFLEDYEKRYDFYHKVEHRIPFDIDYFNKITKGGIPRKTLNVALAGTGVGKSLFMCHCAAHNLTQNHNVLYITMEMSEERIAERIDANLLNVTMEEISLLPKDAYEKKIKRIEDKTKGKLIVKEYPTASAGSGHFRHLLNELRLKRNFTPAIIYIDYLNICASSRLKQSAGVNSYTYVKAIAEELRGLAVEFDVPIVTATQTTRSGFTNSDIGLEDTSESFGLPATADFMFALISNEELQDLNQMLVKQLKNRYNDPTYYKKFVIGVDRSKMKLYDVEQHAQQDLIVDSRPLFDQSDTGARIKHEKKFDKNTFENFS
jgi:archaellum biogenesis ATPase FlaH